MGNCSHFHSDHYGGMTANWSHGPIYCSSITANLVLQQIKVSPEYVIKLPMYQTVDVEGVDVTLIDANQYVLFLSLLLSPSLFPSMLSRSSYAAARCRIISVSRHAIDGSCPGSVLFLFEKKIGKRIYRILHCGDFRASPAHINHPVLKGKYLDAVYLDTTYLKSLPSAFLPRPESDSPCCIPIHLTLLVLSAPPFVHLIYHLILTFIVQNTPSPSKKTSSKPAPKNVSSSPPQIPSPPTPHSEQ